ncbi:hypothetical protein [Lawsonibacter sp. JLR.KK007]|uniref:hypothetical protein n=1 Tax=Lawsonibacter sp. JLR.KK007 TaxID=3114293 RepID=UPI002FF1D033
MKEKWEVRYFVTAVASVPVYKAYSKTETYRQAAKDGWGTVYRDENNALVCDEDCAADLYTKNGGYFGIRAYEEIATKEMPKQAECAAIIVSDSCGFTVWAEDFGKVHIFVSYDENGLIDNYRVEYDDATIYDGEVEISFDDLYERAEEDYQETYRAELPGTVEYQHKQEADKLALEAGETLMNAEEREQFRQVCHKIDGIKSAWDFLCTMSLLEYDYDKKIINAARKFKNCFSFAQYEKPQEAARREELMEDYRKFEFVTADTDTAEQDAEQTTEAACKEAATAAGADTTAAATGKLGQQGAQETERKAGGGAGPPPPGKGERG